MLSRWISVSLCCYVPADCITSFAIFQYISHFVLCRYFLKLLPLLAGAAAGLFPYSFLALRFFFPFSLVPCPFVDFATFTHLLHFVGLRIDVVAAATTAALLVCYLALLCFYYALFLAPGMFRFAVCRRNVKRKFTTHSRLLYIYLISLLSFCSAIITRIR